MLTFTTETKAQRVKQLIYHIQLKFHGKKFVLCKTWILPKIFCRFLQLTIETVLTYFISSFFNRFNSGPVLAFCLFYCLMCIIFWPSSSSQVDFRLHCSCHVDFCLHSSLLVDDHLHLCCPRRYHLNRISSRVVLISSKFCMS